jgi:hypothetical protein
VSRMADGFISFSGGGHDDTQQTLGPAGTWKLTPRTSVEFSVKHNGDANVVDGSPSFREPWKLEKDHGAEGAGP